MTAMQFCKTIRDTVVPPVPRVGVFYRLFDWSDGFREDETKRRTEGLDVPCTVGGQSINLPRNGSVSLRGITRFDYMDWGLHQ